MAATWVREEKSVVKGAIAGMAAGLAASYVMNKFQSLWMRAAQAIKSENEASQASEGEAEQEKAGGTSSATEEQEPQDPLSKTAKAVSEKVLRKDISTEQAQKAAPAVHYGFGTMVGGVYGALAEIAPLFRLGNGTAYGAAVWLFADEIALPLLKLSKAPQKYPVSQHLYALVSHLVYGATTHALSRAVRRVL